MQRREKPMRKLDDLSNCGLGLRDRLEFMICKGHGLFHDEYSMAEGYPQIPLSFEQVCFNDYLQGY